MIGMLAYPRLGEYRASATAAAVFRRGLSNLRFRSAKPANDLMRAIFQSSLEERNVFRMKDQEIGSAISVGRRQ